MRLAGSTTGSLLELPDSSGGSMINLHDGSSVVLYVRCGMRGTVLLVDNNDDVAALVSDVLREEGFAVVRLAHPGLELIQDEVDRLEPDVVLLDGGGAGGYGESWTSAAWMHGREPAIPVIMFTAHTAELDEAQRGETPRSQYAAFVAFVGKPFDLVVLVDSVNRAVQKTTRAPFVRP